MYTSNKLYGRIFLVCLFITLLPTNVNAEKSLSAVWESYGVKPSARQLKQHQQLAKLVKRSQEQERAKHTTKKAWQKQWRAQQPKRKLAQQNRVAAKHVAPAHKTKVKKQAPVQLTRAQYQQRFKQLQRQKQLRQLVLNKKIAANKKQKVVAYKPSTQSAQFNRLPLTIISKLRDAGITENGMSVFIQDVNSKKPLLAYKDKTSRVPASVMKLITSYAALGVLGPNYRWPMDVFTQGKIQKGTLTGDLIIKGYGAPEFNKVELRKMLHAIRAKGIRSVKGRIVFDNSYFSIPKQSSAAFDGKGYASYNAQPDALLFNERISEFNIRANRRGKRVSVSTSTPTHNVKIVNRMRKVRRGCRPRISISHRGAITNVTFSGTFSRRCGTRSYARVISRPAEMIYGSMKAMWKREVGGTLKTRFAIGKAPAKLKPLLRTYSRTLAEILPSIDKDSNNVMARQLLLSIGAKRTGHGTPRSGANVVNQWLVSQGLRFPELRIENGSGLSRLARISARHLGDLLINAYRSPFRHYLMQSLAIAGVDGTMKRRLRGSLVRGKGFFKTGTLKNVRSIAGYVKAANGQTYVMAILHNDPKAKHRSIGAHNSLIEWVYTGVRNNKPKLALK
jgi:D-alanyl-D-alanine carboxypeptidase/D-alanyl-D-alanine-endopeptidase (penicillin-binding protein 4)